jgi:hypothetical protein
MKTRTSGEVSDPQRGRQEPLEMLLTHREEDKNLWRD